MKLPTSVNSRSLRLVLLAFALVGGLAILYAKTESIDLREPNEIASLLRELPLRAISSDLRLQVE